MSLTDLLITAVALSMDAFAVAVSKGLSVCRVRPKHWLITGAYFGGFQGLMPLIGFALASTFASYIRGIDHWVAFLLLAFIGGNMIKEALSKEEEEDCNDSFTFKVMLPLAIATSIDAMAAGISFSCAGVTWDGIWFGVACIGVITFLFSAAGVKIGNIFGTKYKSKAELLGGIILILMGLKILIEHLSGKA
ncbi:MAG: manganese efflux pump [Oscillospiraceae bacterium]|nr:manganese efflux pump [Oscillospiraceae bacterium]